MEFGIALTSLKGIARVEVKTVEKDGKMRWSEAEKAAKDFVQQDYGSVG